MTRSVTIHALEACSPERFSRIGAGLLQQVEEDRVARLVVARLEGEALLLGRHQRASSALELPEVERHRLLVVRSSCGGRTVHLRQGSLGLLLALPSPGSLLLGPIGADKVLNRYVRGLNVALSRLGAGSGAHYFGRDFISAESQQLGVVSQDGTASGATLFQAIVATSSPLAVDPSLLGYPEHGDPRAFGPPWTTLDALAGAPREFAAMVEAIVEGYGGALELSFQRGPGSAPLPEADVAPAVFEDEEGFEDSGVADIPIGFAEALVKAPFEPVTEVRLRGDFIVPAFVVREMERRLVGKPLEFQALGTEVDECFRLPFAALHGIRSKRIFPDAVLAASGKL